MKAKYISFPHRHINGANRINYFQKYAHYPILKFIESSIVHRLYSESLKFNTRQAEAGKQGVEWSERGIDLDSSIGCFFSQTSIVTILRQFLERSSKITRCHIWTSEYKHNEYINPHKDTHGTIQLLICLKNECAPGSGILGMAYNGAHFYHDLKPGDAVLFKATDILHWTSPAIGKTDDAPCRIVLVARYHFQDQPL